MAPSILPVAKAVFGGPSPRLKLLVIHAFLVPVPSSMPTTLTLFDLFPGSPVDSPSLCTYDWSLPGECFTASSSTCPLSSSTTPSSLRNLFNNSASRSVTTLPTLGLRGARPGAGKTQSVCAFAQFVQGTFLSHFTFLLRQVTQDLAFSPLAPLCEDFLSTGLWGAVWDPGEEVDGGAVGYTAVEVGGVSSGFRSKRYILDLPLQYVWSNEGSPRLIWCSISSNRLKGICWDLLV
jgi:hypothetical protein